MSEGQMGNGIENAPLAAVVFDVGRVIVEWDLRHLFAKLIDDAQELDWFLTHVVTEEWHFQHDAGRPLDDMLPERTAQFPAYADLINAYRARFLETIPGPVAGTASIIERLAGAGMPLFAITNFGDEFWAQFFPTRPELQFFRDIVVSGTEKLAKPDPAIFHLAQQRFGFAPGRMLFVDDNSANIHSADRLGWQTHLFTDADRLEHDLNERGLLA
ncbi:HAD family hydrolase [Pontixanthobacter sp.]|uniref:HAD family hydrolase n=1 Tax=Pontixanthobacter sp. TaxID=2792078 RepID=UPI003C7A414D